LKKNQEVESCLKKDPQAIALFKSVKARATPHIGGWFHHKNGAIWFYIGKKYYLENSFS
jgi:hypothetical protein